MHFNRVCFNQVGRVAIMTRPPVVPNTLYHEDCIHTMGRMSADMIDLTVTSPPYDDMRTYNGYSFNFELIAQELYRVTKPGGTLVWVVGDQTKDGDESCTSFTQALYFRHIGYKLLDTMIYLKTARGGHGSCNAYWQQFEYMFVFTKGRQKPPNFLKDRKNKYMNAQTVTRRKKDGTLWRDSIPQVESYGRRTNVWRYPGGRHHSTKDKYAFDHPAIFQEDLAKDHILSWSNPGDLIYDPFSGSGTTAKMAALNDRKYIGSEISIDYHDIAEKRLKSCNTILPHT